MIPGIHASFRFQWVKLCIFHDWAALLFLQMFSALFVLNVGILIIEVEGELDIWKRQDAFFSLSFFFFGIQMGFCLVKSGRKWHWLKQWLNFITRQRHPSWKNRKARCIKPSNFERFFKSCFISQMASAGGAALMNNSHWTLSRIIYTAQQLAQWAALSRHSQVQLLFLLVMTLFSPHFIVGNLPVVNFLVSINFICLNKKTKYFLTIYGFYTSNTASRVLVIEWYIGWLLLHHVEIALLISRYKCVGLLNYHNSIV